MLDILYLLIVVGLYVVTHLIVIGVRRLGGIE